MMAAIHLSIYITPIFALALQFSSVKCSQATKIDGRVNWAYLHQNNEKYYLDTALEAVQSSSSPLTSFDVLLNGNDTMIQIVVDQKYAGIASSRLTSISSGTFFTSVPLLTDPNSFHLMFKATQEFLVTPMTRPPFIFYLQSRYPDITEPAVFSFEPVGFSVEELYNRTRSNTRKTLEAIRGTTDGNKGQYYMELVNITQRLFHWEGKEIFLIASFIKTDLGIDSEPFKALPQQVQNLIGNDQLSLTFYSTYLRQEMQVVNSTYIYNAEIIKTVVYPFNFAYNQSSGLWSIKINNRASTIMNPNGPPACIFVKSKAVRIK